MIGPNEDDAQDKKSQGGEPQPSEGAPEKPAIYKTGKNHPPKKNQFRPGTSGNPAGRPKAKRLEATDADAILDKLLAEPRTVIKNGRPTKLPTNEARLAVLVEQALRGNMPAHRLLFQHYSRRRAATPEPATPDYSAELRRRIEEMAHRWEEGQKPKEK
jgi:hypothetical protein